MPAGHAPTTGGVDRKSLLSKFHRFRSQPEGGKLQLSKLDLASGAIASYDFPPTGAGTSLAASPDGKRLIVSREAPTVIDLMLAPR